MDSSERLKAIVKTNRLTGSFLREKAFFSYFLLFYRYYQYARE
ncbi:hypothetical protein D068_cds15190 [Bacillus atrophaeus UCMB-5137]|nr:hypothetical protein D068_cds15190 [Bacillus atrophaeus UCMB-5137]